MNGDSSIKRPIAGRIILAAWMIIWLGLPIGPAIAQESPNGSNGDEIVAVDIPYDLFLSLARYEYLTEAERQGQHVAAELVPVIDTIVEALETEREKFQLILAQGLSDRDLRRRLAQLNRLIHDYENELRHRRKALELDRLLEQQKSLIGGD
jgi:hypothetical protein